jgi:hypothetical protein
VRNKSQNNKEEHTFRIQTRYDDPSLSTHHSIA